MEEGMKTEAEVTGRKISSNKALRMRLNIFRGGIDIFWGYIQGNSSELDSEKYFKLWHSIGKYCFQMDIIYRTYLGLFWTQK